MYRTPSLGVLVLALISLHPSSAWSQGTSSATIAGLVTDTSGALPLVDTQTVTRQTVLPKALLDAVPSAKTLLSYYALTPALQSPTNAQDVGGSKGETSSRASLHGSKQGDTKMLLDGMSFNW